GRLLRARFRDCAFVVVDNYFLGEPKPAARHTTGYRALEVHGLRIEMPWLAPDYAAILENPGVSLSDIMREPLSFSEADELAPLDLTFDARASLRAWTVKVFQGIHRVTRSVA